MSAGMKRGIYAAIWVAVIGGLLAFILLPVAPDRVDYTEMTSSRVQAPATAYLTSTPMRIGASGADIQPDRVTTLKAAQLTYAPGSSGAGSWTVASLDPSVTVTVDSKPATGVALTDGAVIVVKTSVTATQSVQTDLTYYRGRAGVMGFLDRIDADPIASLFVSPSIMGGAFTVVLKAFPVSLALGVLGFLFAIPLGLGLAFMKMSRTRLLRVPATIYVDIVRGTPLFLQIIVVFFAIPLLPAYKSLVAAWPLLNSQTGPLGVPVSMWIRGLFVLSFNSAAYMAEIFRAGIQSISKGQSEAARSLGMNAVQSMAFVILPQTVRRILPTMMSEFILLFKDTAMLSAVGVGEMVMRAREVAATQANESSYLLAAAFYLVVTIPLGRLVQRLENKLAASEGAGGHEGKREPMVPEPIDSEHVIPHSELLPGVTRPERTHRKDDHR